MTARERVVSPEPSSLLFGRRPIRLLIAVLAILTLAAAFVRYRFETRRPVPAPPLIAQVRQQLGLGPVLEAEQSLRDHPDDPRPRLHLSDACATSGDPVGAALALYPLLDRINGISGMGSGRNRVEGGDDRSDRVDDPSDRVDDPGKDTPAWVGQFVIACAQVGWREEAARALRRLPAVPPRAALEVANAFALHGEAARAVALLDRLEREQPAALGRNDWLDGAMTWYQCRQPRRAAHWAGRAEGREQGGESSEEASVAAKALRARCLLAAGEPEAALRALPEAASGGAAGPLARYWRARAGLRSRDAALRQASREHLTHLGMEEPGDPVAAFEAGRAHLQAGQAAPAAELLTRAARSGYQEVLTYELLAQAYARLDQQARAAWARGRAENERGQFAAAEASLRRSLALDPSPAGAYLDLARVLLLREKPREALQVLERGQQRHPASLDLALGRAEALNQLDRFDEQARVLEAAASLDPSRAVEPLRNLGKMYHETRQFDRMVPVLERAVRHSDGDAESHRFLGLAYALRPEQSDQAEKAVRHLLRAAALDPGDAIAWTNAGAVLQRMGHRPEAAACYRRAIAGDSAADGPYASLARLLQQQGRSTEARLLLKLYREKRDLQARRRDLENRITADRGDAAAHYAMGDLLLRHEGPRPAYPYLLIAASLRPEWKQARARLADASVLVDYADLWQPQGPPSPRAGE